MTVNLKPSKGRNTMGLESGKRSFSTSSSGSVDVFIKAGGKRHRRHESLPRDETTRASDDAIQDTDSMTETSFDVSLEKAPSGIERSRWWKVYAMHFLFMWNSRTYEYVSIFLVASAFPKSLTATSIRGLASTISALLCSSAVGSWIDRSPSRKRTILIAICLNHIAIVASYFCWLSWPLTNDDATTPSGPFSDLTRGFLFGTILLLDVVHDLSTIGYRLCLERDWVPVLVGPITADMDYGLTQVNAVMMRIELVCKLVAPSLLPLIVKSFATQTGWVLLLATSTILCWALGIWCVQVIAHGNVQLQLPKQIFTTLNRARNFNVEDTFTFPKLPQRSWPRRVYGLLYRDPITRLKHYFSFSIWPASISIALLQLTVLAYSATLITYLLEVGFSLSAITVARASGSILGLSGTIITPAAVTYFKKRYTRKLPPNRQSIEEDGKAAESFVTRTVGFWGVASQFICLIPVVILLWKESPKVTGVSEASPHILVTVTLFALLSLSRIGHFANYLMVQELGQVEIPASQRSTFAGVEQSFKSLGELSHWVATVVWSQPEDFRWLALGSLLVTGLSAGIFGVWVHRGVVTTGEPRGDYEGIPLANFDDDESELSQQGLEATRSS